MLLQLLEKLAPAVQPLVFELDNADTPYSVLGTAFLVGFEGHSYVVTTRHGLNPENVGPICIFPSDTSHRLIPLKDVFFVSREDSSEDFVDLAVISVDTSRISHAEVASATVINLGLACGEWEDSASDAQFVILGFPADNCFVDYETNMIRTERIILRGRYIGPSSIPYLHELELSEPHELETFNGLSGSPILSWVTRPGQQPALIFCGMALRGSAASGQLHFLDRSILLEALRTKRALEAMEV